ncbi:spermidine synthase [Pigmentiphaga aceris]|uniref:Spermidine synthase n=1 Tax=Pigmentiphaga aceris TaxID=1940612 RepID=A0A5C0AWB9_9BURK|nr:fused MFS/spermidine synthase [Pigmentiphaga aceris]QEI05170.1 spermidine synthase [Pigmentiphaga aceris]
MPAKSAPPLLVPPVVEDIQGNRILHFSAPEMQSRMNLLQPDALDLEYTRMMMAFLMFNATPERIAMIGLGGGSLPKFCYRYLPKAQIEVVEINPGVIALRDEFKVPKDDARFAILEADGAQFVTERQDHADVLLVDGFDRKGVPAQLSSQDFYDACYDYLREGGIMVVNLHLSDPQQGEFVNRIRESFGSSVFEVLDDDLTNSIVFACKGDRFDSLGDGATRRPDTLSKDAWRQLMPTFRVVAATMTLR